jgi:hypothetical protein
MSFRLAPLLRVRRLQADAAAAAAGAASARATAAQQTAAERRADLAATQAPQVGDEWLFRATIAARSARSSMFTESLAFAAVQEEAAVGARGEWAEARRAVRTLERLEERHLAAQVAAQLAAEQLVLDEHAGRSRRPVPEAAR